MDNANNANNTNNTNNTIGYESSVWKALKSRHSHAEGIGDFGVDDDFWGKHANAGEDCELQFNCSLKDSDQGGGERAIELGAFLWKDKFRAWAAFADMSIEEADHLMSRTGELAALIKKHPDPGSEEAKKSAQDWMQAARREFAQSQGQGPSPEESGGMNTGM